MGIIAQTRAKRKTAVAAAKPLPNDVCPDGQMMLPAAMMTGYALMMLLAFARNDGKNSLKASFDLYSTGFFFCFFLLSKEEKKDYKD